jgi:hypothetical protein
VQEQFGETKARALFFDNPMAAFEGWNLPHVPQIAGDGKPKKRKRFLFF